MASSIIMTSTSGLSISSDQSKAWVDASTKTMQRAGFYAREAMERLDLDVALKHAAVGLGELRTVLAPSDYFELWTVACGDLATLEAFFSACSEYTYDHRALYQKVQSAGNVLPRLYLVLTVGSATLKHLAAGMAGDSSNEAVPVTIPELLTDMQAMCKGVQHPMRGLFLRAYLLQSAKSALHLHPAYSVQFLLENFVEMNKLWVRTKYADEDWSSFSGASSRVHKSREQLADLVGKNLLYLAELVAVGEFADVVLGKILDQVVSCGDTIAQTYLMECITAVFPDEFLIATIGQLLDVLPKLDASVEMAAVLGSMLDRLAKCTEADSMALQNLEEIRAFEKIGDAVEMTISTHKERLSGESIVSLYGGLLSFAETVWPGRVAYIDDVLGTCASHFSASEDSNEGEGCRGALNDAATNKKLMELLCVALEKHELATVLNIQHVSSLFNLLTSGKQKEFAYKVATMMLERHDTVRDVASARALIGILKSLYGREADEDDSKMFTKTIHLIRVEDAIQQVSILGDVADGIKGRDDMVRSIGPAIVFSALEAIGSISCDTHTPCEVIREMMVFSTSVCSEIAAAGSGAQAVGLLLRVVAAAVALWDHRKDRSGSIQASVVYECMERACQVYEGQVYDSLECRTTLANMIATLPTVDAVLPSDARDMLHHKVSSYCAKLLSRKDQCRAIVSLARIERDGPTVLDRLQRAERLLCAIQEQDAVFASTRTPEQLAIAGHLLVEVLDAYVYHKRLGTLELTDDEVGRLVASADSAGAGYPDVQAYLRRVRDAYSL